MATDQQPAAENNDIPGVVAEAFAQSAGSRIGELRLQPLTMAHYLAMKRFCKGFLAGTAARDDLELLRALLILSRPAGVMTELLALDADELDKRLPEFATTLPLASIGKLAEAISAHVAAAFGTALPAAGGTRTEKKTALGGGSRRSSSAAASSTGRSATR